MLPTEIVGSVVRHPAEVHDLRHRACGGAAESTRKHLVTNEASTQDEPCSVRAQGEPAPPAQEHPEHRAEKEDYVNLSSPP
jgi:hypothetical protein